jgi:hypothetical protein
MKIEAIALLSLALTSLAHAGGFAEDEASVDPRVTRLIREELSTNQRYCATFQLEGGSASVVGMDCGIAAGDWLAENVRLSAEGRPGVAVLERDQVLPNTGLYCRELGEYARGFVGADCDTWNRERSALVLYAVDRPEPTFSERVEIDRRIRNVKAYKTRMCQSLAMAGSRGRGENKQARNRSCLFSAAQAERTERALFLREFPLD